MDIGTEKERISRVCREWCNLNLGSVPKNELHAAIKGIGILPWYQFSREQKIPECHDPASTELNMFAWECFQEECLHHYLGIKH